MDMTDAALYLSSTLITVDRCRHESARETVLWFFCKCDVTHKTPDGLCQIGSASRLPGDFGGWTTTKMLNGMPVAQRRVKSLHDVTNYIMELL